MRPGDVSRAHGQIGIDHAKPNGPFAVFEKSADGEAALNALLQTKSVQGRTIMEEMAKFAPKTDKNNPTAYATMLAGAMGVPTSTKMSALTPAQLKTFVEHVEQQEGFNDPNGTVKVGP